MGTEWELGRRHLEQGLPSITGDGIPIPQCYSIAQTLLQPPGLHQALFSWHPTSARTGAQHSLCGVRGGTDPSPPGYRCFGISCSAVWWGVSPSPSAMTPLCFIPLPWPVSSSWLLGYADWVVLYSGLVFLHQSEIDPSSQRY